MSAAVGEQFVHALGTRDHVALKGLLRADVNFRAMTPGQFWEADDANAVVDDIMLGQWFEDTDRITDIEAVETATVGPRERVGYRFKVTNPDGRYLVEQQAYFEVDDGKIAWLRIMCAGYLPDDG